MITAEQIHKKLSDALRATKMTQTEIANKLGINQSNISCYIKGSKTPTLETFANLCAILDIDTNEILCQDSFDKN